MKTITPKSAIITPSEILLDGKPFPFTITDDGVSVSILGGGLNVLCLTLIVDGPITLADDLGDRA